MSKKQIKFLRAQEAIPREHYIVQYTKYPIYAEDAEGNAIDIDVYCEEWYDPDNGDTFERRLYRIEVSGVSPNDLPNSFIDDLRNYFEFELEHPIDKLEDNLTIEFK